MTKILTILVFDRDKSFFKYFRNLFSDFKFIFYLDTNDEFFLANDFDLIIFIQEGGIEKHIMFFKLFKNEIPIVFGSYERRSIYKTHQMDKVKNVRLINMLGSKIEIAAQLRKYLDKMLIK